MTEYEKLLAAERNGAYTVEIRDKITKQTGVANSHLSGVDVYICGDDDDDRWVHPTAFNTNYEITAIIGGKDDTTLANFYDDLKIWLAKHTGYCAETREVIADTIGIITSRPWINESKKNDLLRKIFEASPIGFDQIEYLAKRQIPPEIVTYPVNIEARRFYRIYIQAHEGAGEEEIQRLVKECIKEKGLDDGDLDPEITLEEDDVEINVDWDGAMND